MLLWLEVHLLPWWRAWQRNRRWIESRSLIINDLWLDATLAQDVLLFAELSNKLIAVIDAAAKRANFVGILFCLLSHIDVYLRSCVLLGSFTLATGSRSSLSLTLRRVGIDWLRRWAVFLIIIDCWRPRRSVMAAFDHWMWHCCIIFSNRLVSVNFLFNFRRFVRWSKRKVVFIYRNFLINIFLDM